MFGDLKRFFNPRGLNLNGTKLELAGIYAFATKTEHMLSGTLVTAHTVSGINYEPKLWLNYIAAGLLGLSFSTLYLHFFKTEAIQSYFGDEKFFDTKPNKTTPPTDPNDLISAKRFRNTYLGTTAIMLIVYANLTDFSLLPDNSIAIPKDRDGFFGKFTENMAISWTICEAAAAYRFFQAAAENWVITNEPPAEKELTPSAKTTIPNPA